MFAKLSSKGVFEIGYQRLNLDYYGIVHSVGNLFIYSRLHMFLMVVDVVAPGWMPGQSFMLATDGKKYYASHDIMLQRYYFNYFVGGHIAHIGTPRDIEMNKHFLDDLFEATEQAISEIDMSEIAATAINAWDIISTYQRTVSERCVELLNANCTNSDWFNEWQGIDQWIYSQCYAAQLDVTLNH